MSLLETIQSPADLRRLPREQLRPLADELLQQALQALECSGLKETRLLAELALHVVARQH